MAPLTKVRLTCVIVATVWAASVSRVAQSAVLLKEDFGDGDFTKPIAWRVPLGKGSWRVENGRLVGARHVAKKRPGYPNGNCLETGFRRTPRPIQARVHYTNRMHCPSNSVSVSLLKHGVGPGGGGYMAQSMFQYKHCKFHLYKRTPDGLVSLAATEGPTDEVGRFARLELRVLRHQRVEMWYDHVLVAAARDDAFQTFDTVLINNAHQQGGAHAVLDDVVVATGTDDAPDDFPPGPVVRPRPPGPDAPGPVYVLADPRLHAQLGPHGKLLRLVHHAGAPGARDRWMPPIVWWGRGLAGRPGLVCATTEVPTEREHKPELAQGNGGASITFRRTLQGGTRLSQTFRLQGTGVLSFKVALGNDTAPDARVGLALQGEPLGVADARVRAGFDTASRRAFICSPDYARSELTRPLPKPSPVARVCLDSVLEADMNSPRLGIGLRGVHGTCRFEVPRHPGHVTELVWQPSGGDAQRATRRGVCMSVKRKGRLELAITAQGIAGLLGGKEVLRLPTQSPACGAFDTVVIGVNGARVTLLALAVHSPGKPDSPILHDAFRADWPARYRHTCPGLVHTVSFRPMWYYFYVPRPTDILAWRALPGHARREQAVDPSGGWMALAETTFRRGLALRWSPRPGVRLDLRSAAADLGWRLRFPERRLARGASWEQAFSLIPFVGLTGVSSVTDQAVVGAHRVSGYRRLFRPAAPWQLDPCR